MVSKAFARSLLHVSVPLADNGHDEHDDLDIHEDTKALRIASIFVILVAGMIGGCPPLLVKAFRDPDSTATRLVRSFSAGVIAALALVHIIPEAVVEMIGLGGIEYPLGGTCVLLGIALMVLLEHTAHIMFQRIQPSRGKGSDGGSGHLSCAHHRHGSSKSDRTLPLVSNAVHPAVAALAAASEAASPEKAAADTDGEKTQSRAEGLRSAGGGATVAAATAAGHRHVCVSLGSASNWAMATTAQEAGGRDSLRLKVVAWLMEAGCVFHSVIIGIGLGVNQTGVTEVRSLLIALAFHQWLEGMSLGGVVALAGFPNWKAVTMILTYSLTCPVGIAVGMGIAETYDEESERARGVQGAFNGVSGGMLLYISLVQMIAEDMGRVSATAASGQGLGQARSRLGCFAALCGGAGAMCLLALWA
ncbi:hypothetical protein GPECTOR_63g34 [Gonium pectorale]|uniref:ZIP protein n=1 Tax=Gonium pectorale TaxID=33097 RepID=A0A150G4C1_GONPE|nr:hypothetical protein GPECTOR_63g34 [Gonium pectorale]|eukprot:KXZ44707.1 hypothetical protein GPECTOR_63g34 [Gonium pectorale]